MPVSNIPISRLPVPFDNCIFPLFSSSIYTTTVPLDFPSTTTFTIVALPYTIFSTVTVTFVSRLYTSNDAELLIEPLK